jgi:hypothetical protein
MAQETGALGDVGRRLVEEGEELVVGGEQSEPKGPKS